MGEGALPGEPCGAWGEVRWPLWSSAAPSVQWDPHPALSASQGSRGTRCGSESPPWELWAEAISVVCGPDIREASSGLRTGRGLMLGHRLRSCIAGGDRDGKQETPIWTQVS